jgi:hypothetical protein
MSRATFSSDKLYHGLLIAQLQHLSCLRAGRINDAEALATLVAVGEERLNAIRELERQAEIERRRFADTQLADDAPLGFQPTRRIDLVFDPSR